ncbi:DNA-binding storekeeper protein-related [Tripterygium wilfordii]|uniref:DNA-binding storekeeper protein-related n=1 Tax=Tripterygium wilfordii TaxID=458696 RepID=A0A7J7DJH0_TRIWF|nr:TLC domain-containing protein At5g14285-like [Tripterygium wilfordii]KAF5746491.1 DNA-binding storekeeper protein-related [Tripterygium wilfordii]
METQLLFSPTFPTFFMMFFFIYIFAYFVIFRNWASKERAEASSCFLSLFHGTPAVIMSIGALILTQNQSQLSFASPNSTLQNTVLEFSMAYFVMDLLHYIVFSPHEILFILHHVATLYVFATCHYMVRHGAVSLLVLLVLAEVTSACHNVWSLSRFRRHDVPAANRLYEVLSPCFYVFYSIVRGILGPIFVSRMGMFYAGGVAGTAIPSWAWISWMVVIVIAILVSIFWVFNHWVDWHKQMINKAEKRMR